MQISLTNSTITCAYLAVAAAPPGLQIPRTVLVLACILIPVAIVSLLALVRTGLSLPRGLHGRCTCRRPASIPAQVAWGLLVWAKRPTKDKDNFWGHSAYMKHRELW